MHQLRPRSQPFRKHLLHKASFYITSLPSTIFGKRYKLIIDFTVTWIDNKLIANFVERFLKTISMHIIRRSKFLSDAKKYHIESFSTANSALVLFYVSLFIFDVLRCWKYNHMIGVRRRGIEKQDPEYNMKYADIYISFARFGSVTRVVVEHINATLGKRMPTRIFQDDRSRQCQKSNVYRQLCFVLSLSLRPNLYLKS